MWNNIAYCHVAVAYLMQEQDNIVWLFQTVWCQNADGGNETTCYVSSISGHQSTRQQRIWCHQRMHQDTAVVLSPTRPAKLRVSEC